MACTVVRGIGNALHANRDIDGHFVGLFVLVLETTIFAFLGNDLIACSILVLIGFRLSTATL